MSENETNQPVSESVSTRCSNVSTAELLENYRVARQALELRVDEEFPPKLRVQPIGVITGNWGATVSGMVESERRAMAADMVFLMWDNGNQFPVEVDQLEKR